MVRAGEERAVANEEVVEAIRRWARTLPSGTIHLGEEQLQHEHVVSMTPVAAGAASVQFRLSAYGTFDCFIGQFFRVEEVTSSVTKITEICDAVRRGHYRELVWERRGRATQGVGVLGSGPRRMYNTEWRPLVRWLPCYRRRTVRYAAWD